MNNRRFAALKISQLSRKDKKWLIDQLNKQEKSALDGELQSLRLVSKKIAFGKLFNELDFEALEAIAEKDGINTKSLDERHQSVSDLLEELKPQQLAAVLDKVSCYLVAASTILHPEIGLKYFPLCGSERSKQIREMISELKQPLPQLFAANLEVVLLEDLSKTNDLEGGA